MIQNNTNQEKYETDTDTIVWRNPMEGIVGKEGKHIIASFSFDCSQ